jgi:hypothetical protein
MSWPWSYTNGILSASLLRQPKKQTMHWIPTFSFYIIFVRIGPTGRFPCQWTALGFYNHIFIFVSIYRNEAFFFNFKRWTELPINIFIKWTWVLWHCYIASSINVEFVWEFAESKGKLVRSVWCKMSNIWSVSWHWAFNLINKITIFNEKQIIYF